MIGPVTSDSGNYSEDWIRNGHLEQQTEVHSESWISWSTIEDLPLQDFYLKVDAAFVEATSEDSWLHFLLRYDEATGNYYRVRFDSEGYYIIDLLYDEEWHTLQTWTRSRAIRLQPGETSTFELWLRGEYLTIAVNGTELTTIQDDRLTTSGAWGLGNGGPEGTKNTVIYDNLLIKESPE